MTLFRLFLHSFLSLRFKALSFVLKMAAVREAERLSALEKISRVGVEDSVMISTEQQLESHVRRVLRNEPGWRRGHLFLARLALRRNDTVLLTASAYALSKLPGDTGEGRFFLGAALVRSQEFVQAKEILSELQEKVPAWLEVREELGAALFGMGEREEARAVFLSIPESKRSPEISAVLSLYRS